MPPLGGGGFLGVRWYILALTEKAATWGLMEYERFRSLALAELGVVLPPWRRLPAALRCTWQHSAEPMPELVGWASGGAPMPFVYRWAAELAQRP